MRLSRTCCSSGDVQLQFSTRWNRLASSRLNDSLTPRLHSINIYFILPPSMALHLDSPPDSAGRARIAFRLWSTSKQNSDHLSQRRECSRVPHTPFHASDAFPPDQRSCQMWFASCWWDLASLAHIHNWAWLGGRWRLTRAANDSWGIDTISNTSESESVLVLANSIDSLSDSIVYPA
jgi:hypothetical protein